MWYSSQAQDHTHFLPNISNQGLQWESNSMKAKRVKIQVLDNMKTLVNQFNLNRPLIQWVAVHQGTLVLPRLDLGLRVPVPTRLEEKNQLRARSSASALANAGESDRLIPQVPASIESPQKSRICRNMPCQIGKMSSNTSDNVNLTQPFRCFYFQLLSSL